MKVVQLWTCMCSFHVLGSIYSDVRCNEVQTISITARLDTGNTFAGGCYIVATTYFLSRCQWQPNVHATRYKLLHSAIVRKQTFLPLSDSPIAMTSGNSGFRFLHQYCRVWLLCRPVGLQSHFFAETSRNSAGSYLLNVK